MTRSIVAAMKLRALVLAVAVGACGGTVAPTAAPAAMPQSTPQPTPPTTVATPPPATSAPTTTMLASTTTSTTSTTTSTTAVPAVAEDARAVVMAGFAGKTLDPITESHLAEGGRAVILFSRNIESQGQVADLTESIACAAGAPVIVSIDQEPGRVDRLDAIGIPAPSLAAAPDDFTRNAAEMASEMVAIGINLNLAPIADVAQGQNPVLEGRNAGPDSSAVTERALAFMAGLAEGGVAATAKHFPGHGLTRVDPHRDVAVVDASLDTLAETHFPPFQAAIDAGVGAVMVGHPIYQAIDASNPASLSPHVLDMLRNDFGFTGVAMTDGLSMAGLRKIRSIEQAAVDAVVAGQDLLLADRPSDVPRIVATLEEAVATGLLPAARLAEAARRVRQLASELTPVACR